ncbi:MAG: hypothetical protein ACE5J2_07285 [Nitrososphaerales archaeon]
MPIDAGLVIQYLALAFGVTGVVLSLSYPQSLFNRIRLAISSNEVKTGEITLKVDGATAKMEGAIKNMEKKGKQMERRITDIDELNSGIDNVHARIDGISKSLIATEYALRRNGKDLANLMMTVQNMGNRLATIGKSGSELESEISKLGKVTLWAEKNVKELRDEVKLVRSIARISNGHRRLNGNGNAKRIKGNGNGKHTQKVLVKQKAS